RFRAILESARLDGGGDRPILADWLRRPEARIHSLLALLPDPASGVLETLETELKYVGYIAQQERQVNRLREAESTSIPQDFSYAALPGLSRDVQEKLSKVRPATLGQASRIPGVTPAAVAVLDVYLNVSRVAG